MAQIEHAGDIVKGVDGVNDVDNQLALDREGEKDRFVHAGLFAQLTKEQTEQIAQDIQAAFARDPRLDEDTIGVHVYTNGAVELSGSVLDPRQRETAENCVWVLPRVDYVVNRLTCASETDSDTDDESSRSLKGAVANAKFKMALMADTLAKYAVQIRVETGDDGVFILRGDTDNYRDKDSAVELARKLFADSQVRDELTVGLLAQEQEIKDATPTTQREDERELGHHLVPTFSKQQIYESAQEFDQAVAQHPVLDGQGISRTITEQKTMVLEGQVSDEQDARRCEDIAWQVRGINHVVNKISIG